MRQSPKTFSSEAWLGSGDTECRFADIMERLEECSNSVKELQRKQDYDTNKIEEADTVRRNQIQCISNRVFEAEKQLSESSQLQDDAIAKAQAVFTKHAEEVEQERQNLMSVIGQVNRNFEHLSGEIAQHGNASKGVQHQMMQLEMTSEQTSRDVESLSHELRNQSSFVSAVNSSMAGFQQELQDLQDLTNDFQIQSKDLRIKVQETESSLRKVLQSLADERDSRIPSAPSTRLAPTAQQQRGSSLPKDSHPSEMDDHIADERGRRQPAADQEVWSGEFCGRFQQAPEKGLDTDQVHPDYPHQAGGPSFPFATPQRVHSHTNFRAGPAHEHQRSNFHSSFGAYDEYAPEDVRGSSSGPPHSFPPMPQMATAAARQRQCGEDEHVDIWDVNADHVVDDSDAEHNFQEDWEWDVSPSQGYGPNHQESEIHKAIRAHSAQPHASSVPMSEFGGSCQRQRFSA